uniref:Uncharacterized protein n=2 Tax=Anopheles dirus TaxID=7168 RepID=A0A182NWQ0_9DIPT
MAVFKTLRLNTSVKPSVSRMSSNLMWFRDSLPEYMYFSRYLNGFSRTLNLTSF